MLSPEVILSCCHIFHLTNTHIAPEVLTFKRPGSAHLGVTSARSRSLINGALGISLEMIVWFFWGLTLPENRCLCFCLLVPPLIEDCKEAQYVYKSKADCLKLNCVSHNC